MLLDLAILVIAAGASFTLAALVRHNATQLGLVQAPNARSSHTAPTPSGGGVGIVLGGTIAVAAVAITQPWQYAVALVVAALVAAIGFADDRQPIAARYRLPAQLILSGLAIGLAVPLSALGQQAGLPLPELAIGALAIIAVVYWINLFNFMDGIDGIAAAQAIFMGCAGALLIVVQPGQAGNLAAWTLLGIAAASLGFLLLNWPPAKIFMGDAGSTYLGFMLGFLALVTIAGGWLSLPQWLILGAAFVTDATVTLVRRMLLRERVFEAHRRHAYQVLSRRWRSHRKVTLGFIVLNLVWLLPLAWVATSWGWIAVAVAYLPLIGLALYLGAGAPEQSRAASA